MKRLFKKFVTLALAAATLSSTAVFAQNEMTNMKFAGYDTSDVLNPNYIYNEVINGNYTDKQILVRVEDKDIQWRTDANCVEAVYPYAGYSVMYIKNPVTGAFDNTWATAYNNTNPQWQTKKVDWVFELKAPYYIWERQQTNTAFAGWKWDIISESLGNTKWGIKDSDLVRKTSRQAKNVKIEWLDYGFARYDNNGVILDAYKTIGDVHCANCKVFSVGCATCESLLPVAYWSKEDTDMFATQLYFNVLGEAVYGNGISGLEATFTPAGFLADVQAVRACNAHIAKCPVSIDCDHPYHINGLTIAGVLASKYDIVGWDEIATYVLNYENLTARGTVAQDTVKYPRNVYGNLLAAEGANRYYLTDDVIKEIVPMIKAKKITASFTETSELITKVAVEEYIKSETDGINFAVTPATYYNALTNNWTKWDWTGVDALDVKYNVANISWTAPLYEVRLADNDHPFFPYFQFMVVDGIVLDGSNKKPYIFRYTGSLADPKVEWKFDSFVPNAEFAGVYDAVERLYVEGARTTLTRKPAVSFAAPAVTNWQIGSVNKVYSASYFKAAEGGKFIDYYITDNNGIDILVYRVVNYGTVTGASVNPNNNQLVSGNTVFGAPVVVATTIVTETDSIG